MFFCVNTYHLIDLDAVFGILTSALYGIAAHDRCWLKSRHRLLVITCILLCSPMIYELGVILGNDILYDDMLFKIIEVIGIVIALFAYYVRMSKRIQWNLSVANICLGSAVISQVLLLIPTIAFQFLI